MLSDCDPVPITETHYGFEDIRLEGSIDEIAHSFRSFLLAFPANGDLAPTEPLALHIKDLQGVHEDIDIVVSSKGMSIVLFHLLLKFLADLA